MFLQLLSRQIKHWQKKRDELIKKYAAKVISAAKKRLSELVAKRMWKTFTKYAGIFGITKYSSTKYSFRKH